MKPMPARISAIPTTMPKQRELLGHVGEVERRRQRGLRHPGVPRPDSAPGFLPRPSAPRPRRSSPRDSPGRPPRRIGPSGRTSSRRRTRARVSRMYCEKHRASEPVSIGCSATSQDGADTSRPASSIPAWIASGLMSSEPTICSRLQLLADGGARVQAQQERSDPERDQDDAGGNAAPLQQSSRAHVLTPPIEVRSPRSARTAPPRLLRPRAPGRGSARRPAR